MTKVDGDLCKGAKNIAAALRMLGIPCSERQAWYLCETRQIPAFKWARSWCVRQSSLLAHFERLERVAEEPRR